LKKWTKIQLWSWKRRRWLWKDEFKDYDDYDDAESERIEAEDINIDEYLSNDETPDYKTQTNNYSDDDDDRETPFAALVVSPRFNQSVTFILNDEERIAEFGGSIDDMGISVVAFQIW
jgi:RNA polymerase sigma-54 factor